jgi:hypothetical protein
MAVNAPDVAHFQGSRVDKTDAGTPPTHEYLGIYEQGKQGETHQFYKLVVTDRRGKIFVHIGTDITLIILLETMVA